jgi:hypothetical protein
MTDYYTTLRNYLSKHPDSYTNTWPLPDDLIGHIKSIWNLKGNAMSASRRSYTNSNSLGWTEEAMSELEEIIRVWDSPLNKALR